LLPFHFKQVDLFNGNMLDHTIANYVFIRGVIFALRAVTPASIFIVSFSIAEPPHTGFRRFLLAWSLIETVFWVGVFIPRKRALQSAANHPPALNKEERKELFWKCWDKVPHPEYFVSRWFLGARPSDVQRDNVREFYEWALMNRGKETQDDKVKRMQERPEECREEEEELDSYVDGIETLLGSPLAPGRGNVQSMRLTVDAVNMTHRPVLWYMIVLLVDNFTAARMRYNGYSLYRTHLRSALGMFPPRLASLFTRQISSAPDLSYWYRPHTSKTRLPILFIHGIGIGLYPYAKFLDEINKFDPQPGEDGEIGIIAVELMPISFRITGPILDRDEICRQINIILERHGFDKVVLASHSYGSVVTTHLLQNPTTAAKIGPMLFVDPVTFLLHLPDVAYNFTARQPRSTNEHQLFFFASRDMMVAHTLARHFFWAHNLLWKEDLRGRDVTISLGGRDLIVDTDTVGKYLNGVDLKSENQTWKEHEWKGVGLETVWWPTVDHAQVFERMEGRAKLARVLREYCKRTGEEGEDGV
jgi:pimeloyl-ACP methyl ester carboxylesterase